MIDVARSNGVDSVYGYDTAGRQSRRGTPGGLMSSYEDVRFGRAQGVPNSWVLESGEVVTAEIRPYGVRPLQIFVESPEGTLLGRAEIGSELASEALLVEKAPGADWLAVFRQSTCELFLLRLPGAAIVATIPLVRGESNRGRFHKRGLYGALLLEVEDSLLALDSHGKVSWLLPLWPNDEVIAVSPEHLTLRRSQHPTLQVHLLTGTVTASSG